MEFERERDGWKEEFEQAKQEVIEQNDRLTVLSEQLSGRKVWAERINCVDNVIINCTRALVG